MKISHSERLLKAARELFKHAEIHSGVEHIVSSHDLAALQSIVREIDRDQKGSQP